MSASTARPANQDDAFLKAYYRLTAALEQEPYHPRAWLERAELFLGRYNELACADALKAHILCDENTSLTIPSTTVPNLDDFSTRKHRARASWFLYVALRELGAYSAAMEYTDQFPPALLNPRFLPASVSTARWPAVDRPKLGRHRYPWLPQDLLARATRSNVREFMEQHGLLIDKASFTDDHDVKGVFATQDIAEADLIMIDNVRHADANSGVEHQDRNLVFLNHVLETLIDGIPEVPDHRFNLLTLVGLRSLTISFGVPPDDFSFQGQVKSIALYLLQHGQLFSPRFDFWKIFLVYWKVCTNSFSHLTEQLDQNGDEKVIVGMAQNFSFFNHSCDPDAIWSVQYNEEKMSDRPAYPYEIVISARRPINAGQEIFLSYLPPKELSGSVHERRETLRAWLGADCQCQRCEDDDAHRTTQAPKKGKAVRGKTSPVILDTLAEPSSSAAIPPREPQRRTGRKGKRYLTDDELLGPPARKAKRRKAEENK